MSSDRDGSDIQAVGVLADPVRRRLYDYVSGQSDAVSRDDAASAVGIARALAAFHLDRMVREGLLATEYRRLSGRTGPGAGRPAKLYRRAARQVDVSLPPRRYELAARLLASALDGPEGEQAKRALARAANEFGRQLGEEARRRGRERRQDASREGAAGEAELATAMEVLEEYGFEPFTTDGPTIRLRNCPFDALAREHEELVCGMNLSLLQGVVLGLEAAGIGTRLDPQPGTCCVALDLR